MPTFRSVLTGLVIGTTVAGGAVALSTVANVTAASATVVKQGWDEGRRLIDRSRFDRNRFNRLNRRFVPTNLRNVFIDLHNADFSTNIDADIDEVELEDED